MTNPPDPRRCDTGQTDHWGACFACGAIRGEQCRQPKLKRCPVCRGRGALRCDCFPGDCICGFDDEPCDNCEGTGWLDPNERDDD